MPGREKIRLLIVSANPKNTTPLRLEQEKRDIEEAFRSSPCRDYFVIETLPAARIADLRRVFADPERTPHILHFCGHGGGKDGLVFEDQGGLEQLIQGDALAGFFSLFAGTLDCVVLNACCSEIQAREIHKYVNCVIGMEDAIGDNSAVVFASAFYEALFAGRPYQFAYDYAKKSLALEGGNIQSRLLLQNNTSPFSRNSDKIQRDGSAPSIRIAMQQKGDNNRQIGVVNGKTNIFL